MAEHGEDGYRTLNACEACGRQYDVSHLAEGARVRCECGQRFAAHFVRPRSPRHLRCSNCGGNLQERAKACAYCNAEVSLYEKGLSSICPRCWARLADRARFCMECGITIQPQALLALPEEVRCPRCRSELARRELVGAQVVECRSCGGLWLTPDHLEALCKSADGQERAARELRERPAPARADDKHPVRYLPCVACGEMMNRRNYASISGIIVDVCRKHGVWLDHEELEKVLAFVRKGGLDRARERELERLKDERRRARDTAWLPPPDAPLRREAAWSGGDLLVDWLVGLLSRPWR